MAKTKFPKEVGGVEMPEDVRRAADALIKRVDSRLGREALAAGMTLAATAVVAMAGSGKVSFEIDDDDAPEAPEPPQPPEPPVAPVPPTPPTPPEPPIRPEPLRPQPRPTGMSPAQAQAVADALGIKL